MKTLALNTIVHGDCRELLKLLPEGSVSACITDPPYNYEFIGRDWNVKEIKRRISRVRNSKTLVKNIPYGSGLAGGVRNRRWYQRVRENIIAYQDWCHEWGKEVYRVLKDGALVLVFNSTRTVAHVQVGLERAGFYARDCIVWRRHAGIPKGLNFSKKLKSRGNGDFVKWEGWHSCLRSEWEAICVVQKPLTNNYLETVAQSGVGLFHVIRPDGTFQSNIIENIARDSGGCPILRWR